ncbi:hypothetical protein HAX54_038792, partial [Datura stramonium]|nr:hypothetical protein [Datura stramonium]
EWDVQLKTNIRLGVTPFLPDLRRIWEKLKLKIRPPLLGSEGTHCSGNPFIAVCQFRHNKQAIKGLIHERGFIMWDVVDKAPEFYARLQEMGWSPLVKDPFNLNEAW